MNYHQVLRIITTNNKEKIDFHEKLESLLDEVSSHLPAEFIKNIENICTQDNDTSVIRRYLQTILHVLRALQEDVLSLSDTFMSVKQFKCVKAALEYATSIGIISCLLPGIGVGLDKLCPNATELPPEKLTDLQKYNRLTATTRTFTDCYKEISLRPAIIIHLGSLLGALFQLAHAPLSKPTKENTSPSIFETTNDLYNRLTKDQEEFKSRLSDFIKECPQSAVMKELMVLSGMNNAPNWLKRKTKSYLINILIEPTGVISLINATCDDILDVGKDWQALETISNFIVTVHTENSEEYYNSICSQILSILNSKNIKYATNIANSCITALYETHPEICFDKIFNVIIAPLKISSEDEKQFRIRSETEVSQCIDNLISCFLPIDGKVNCLPHKLLKQVAIPLIDINIKLYESSSLLRSKVIRLLMYLLENEESRENLFPVFLRHDEPYSEYFGDRFVMRFGPKEDVEFIEIYKETIFDDFWSRYANTFYNLIKADDKILFELLNYFFKWTQYTNNLKTERLKPGCKEYDLLIRVVCQEDAILNLFPILGGMAKIQKHLLESPEALLSFVISLIPKNIQKSREVKDYEPVSASLLLVKIILMHAGPSCNWEPFNEFADKLDECTKLVLPKNISSMMAQLISYIKNRGQMPRFRDVSIDENSNDKLYEALRDLTDVLIPIRAHGLMTLTKLIETRDPATIAKKDFILHLLRENLEEDDSFIYLSAINGICGMALLFPDSIIQILVEEFTSMLSKIRDQEISPQNCVKLGEILVNVTRQLGETAYEYKNILINGFLNGVRNSDPMIRTSSLSCLGELCKALGFSLGNLTSEVLFCVGCIIKTDKSNECRRAAVLTITKLIGGLGRDVLDNMSQDLLPIYKYLKDLRDHDKDEVLRLHAQLALEELDEIIKDILYTEPPLEKTIFLLPH